MKLKISVISTLNDYICACLFEPNGHADIETAEIQLASNSQTDLANHLEQNGTCASGSANFDYLDCRMISENEEPLTPFTMNSILVDFRLGWNIAVGMTNLKSSIMQANLLGKLSRTPMEVQS